TYARHPEIDEQEIEAPWFGLGLPRTGSSALNNLLSQDSGRRFLRTWEAERPCPPPEAHTPDDDPRVLEVARGIELMHKLAPEFASIHETTATGPNEDGVLLAHEFKSAHLEGLLWVPRYAEWRAACDMSTAYRYHRRVLKLLQWRCPPRRWQLKSPIHLHSFEALLAEYPDARLLVTHRDPARVIPSACSMWRTTMGLYSSDVEDAALGRMIPEYWARSLRSLVEYRARNGDGAFRDIAYRDMMDDPIGTLRDLYASLGEPMMPDTEKAMAAWIDGNPKGKHGAHRYSAEEFGLDPDETRSMYAFYLDRFQIPVES
ncbi:MAG: sulfotransferase, partial [Gaiellales bacterium]